ncbi:uncharacterized protein ARMOST_21070 [Armillaria ostoyae]|uniref:SET domain-containing protein n=1 Tax=Armillaria ostoyae TaxID=47428 RepID=A0A284S937_ARMOS|nr:uncharacterized protein ARMOST_21070 [Armillaria ostoyae]
MKQDSLTTATTTRVLKPTQDSSSVSLLNIYSASLPTPLEEAHACTAELSFNIAENTAKSKGYQGMNYRNASRQTMENQTIHPDDQTIITLQPMPGKSNTLATFPDGWAECMLTAYVKKQILGFPIRLSVQRNRCFMGDLILDERPMMVAPVLSDPRTIAFPENFTEDQILQAAIYEYEKTLGFCFRCMPKETQQAFMGLSNCHQRDGSGLLFGIIRTNGYEVRGLKDKGTGFSFPWSQATNSAYRCTRASIYTVVWDKLSRLKHSCSPNVCRKLNTASFSMQIHAARDIEEGEELTTAHCAIFNPAAKRQTDLAAYDFKCTCAACSDPSKSDVKREGFSHRPVLVPPFVGKAKAKEDWLDPVLKMLAETEEEGVQACLYHKATLQQPVMACVYVGDKDKALMYGPKLAAISRARGGVWMLISQVLRS